MVRLMESQLDLNGYDVFTANDGVACMSMVRKQNPELILLDLGLPAVDGFKTLERLKGLIPFCSILVVVLTGREACEVQERVLIVGAGVDRLRCGLPTSIRLPARLPIRLRDIGETAN